MEKEVNIPEKFELSGWDDAPTNRELAQKMDEIIDFLQAKQEVMKFQPNMETQVTDIDSLMEFVAGRVTIANLKNCSCGSDPDGFCDFCSTWSRARNECEEAVKNYNEATQ